MMRIFIVITCAVVLFVIICVMIGYVVQYIPNESIRALVCFFGGLFIGIVIIIRVTNILDL